MDKEIFRISKNLKRAKALKEMAEERYEDIKNERKVYKIVEQYYEIIKKLITALMYSEGFKTLSHKALIHYLENNYKKFNKENIILIDELRKLRNNIEYYGQRVGREFLINKEAQIKFIIKKLIQVVNKNLKEMNEQSF